MTSKQILLPIAIVLALATQPSGQRASHTFARGPSDFLLDGKCG